MIGSWLKKAIRAGWLGVATLMLAGQSQAAAPPPQTPPQGMPPPQAGAPGQGYYTATAGAAPAPAGPMTPYGPYFPPPGAYPYPGMGYCPPPPPPPPMESAPSPRCCEERPLCYFSVDYLLWGFRSRDLPILVTSGDLADPFPGAIGQPTSKILVGGTSGDDDLRSGIRLSTGLALDESGTWVLDGSFFIVEQEGARQLVVGTGALDAPVIARPFFNAFTNQQDADPIAVPGALSGVVVVETPRQFYGGDLNLIDYFYDDPIPQSRVGLILGGRFASLDQKLVISESLQDLPGLGASPNSYSLREDFTTFNRFYGGQVGLAGDTRFGNITLKVLAKCAFGVTNQTLVTRASTRVTAQDGSLVSASNRGLLIQPSNSGRFTQQHFSVLPEFGAQVLYAFNDSIRVGIGYTAIYWSQVLNPENTVDPVVALQALQPLGQVGPNRPAVNLGRTTDFWAHGLTASLQFTY
jgi:hypothetical protein